MRGNKLAILSSARVFMFVLLYDTASVFLQVGNLENVYEFMLPVEVYHRQSKSITTSYQQVTDSLMQETQVRKM